jgi:hypothetical protein
MAKPVRPEQLKTGNQAGANMPHSILKKQQDLNPYLIN